MFKRGLKLMLVILMVTILDLILEQGFGRPALTGNQALLSVLMICWVTDVRE